MRLSCYSALRAGSGLAVLAVIAGGATQAQAAAGWQGIATYNVTTGLQSLTYTYPCPTTGTTIAHSGSYAMNSVGQSSEVFLTYSGTRLDEPSFKNWAWHFYWPGGAPAGITILFDVYCAKK